MTTDPVPACAAARASRSEQDAASRERRRLKEAVLVRRAKAESTAGIAQALGISSSLVTRLLDVARQAGDQRALTEAQARAQRLVAAARTERVTSAAPPPPPCLPAPSVASGPDALRRPLRPDAGLFHGHLTRYADVYGHTDAGAGFAHLADLYAHCESYYPDLAIPSEGTTLEATRRLFPPARTAPTGACVLA